jgi:hypothetical protein
MRVPFSSRRGVVAALALTGAAAVLGCYNTAPDYSPLAQGPAPRRMPSPQRVADADCCYEDSLTGGQIYSMYCAECHNPRPLSERPFSNFKNVAAHMRVRANLTGKEYAKLQEFLHRWHDVPPPTPPDTPSPKRLIFGQPVGELRDQTAPPESRGTPGIAPNDVLRAPAPAEPPPAAVLPASATAGGPAQPPQP